jgi:hypothetical protein
MKCFVIPIFTEATRVVTEGPEVYLEVRSGSAPLVFVNRKEKLTGELREFYFYSNETVGN